MLLKQTKGFVYLDALMQEPAIELYNNLFLTGGVNLDADMLPSDLFNSLYLPIDEWRQMLRISKSEMRRWLDSENGPRPIYIGPRSRQKCLCGMDIRRALIRCAEPDHGAFR